MKKIFITLSAIALVLTSCTDNGDDKKTDATAQTADATLKIQTEKPTASVTGKDVERGTLYAWIKSIHLQGGAMELSHIANFDFDLVDNGTVGADYEFHLTGLAIGRNDWDVSTTTTTIGSFVSMPALGVPETVMDKLKGQNPYALYSAHITTDIKFGENVQNNIEPVTLKTKNGRHIGVFTLSQQLRDLSVYAVVTPIVNGVTQTALGIKVGVNGYCYWSDGDAIEGHTIQYDVKLFRGDGNPLMDNGVQIGFQSVVVPIVASTSVNRIYTIAKASLTENSQIQQFVAEEWKDDNSTATVGGN